MHPRFSRALAPLFLACLAACSKQTPPAGPPKAPTVGVFKVEPQAQAISSELPGRTKARLVAEIRPQVGGIVLRRLFEEGAVVKAGQALYEIDPATYRAAVASAEAGVSKASATLGSARTVAERDAELVKIDAISQQQRDTSGTDRAKRECGPRATAEQRREVIHQHRREHRQQQNNSRRQQPL